MGGLCRRRANCFAICVKFYAVRHNVGFVMEIRDQYGGFGKFLTNWKPGDQTGLLDFFKQRASRLGGMTGQYFLRRAGWDGFILTPDVMDLPDRARSPHRQTRLSKDTARSAGIV